jgi:hypothetical protein
MKTNAENNSPIVVGAALVAALFLAVLPVSAPRAPTTSAFTPVFDGLWGAPTIGRRNLGVSISLMH